MKKVDFISYEEDVKISNVVSNIEEWKEIHNRDWVIGAFNSGVKMYVDSCGISGCDIGDWFRDKVVVYLAFTKDNRANIGYSSDFGQRLYSYCMDCKGEKNNDFIKSCKRLHGAYFIPLFCRSFSCFIGGRDEALKWGRRIEQRLHSRLQAVGENITNVRI